MRIRLLIFLFYLFQTLSYSQSITADFSAAPTLGSSVPHTVFFTDESINPDIWLWTFGDGGTTSTVQNPVHSYTTTGEFEVNLKVDDTLFGTSDNITKMVRISIPAADFSRDSSFGCGPLTVNFTDTSIANGAPIVAWDWDFGDGETSTEQNPTHIYKNRGSFSVVLEITDDFGNTHVISRPNAIQVIGPSPNFSTTDPTTGCLPLTINFVNETTFGAPLTSFEWDFGDGTISNTIGNVNHTYTTAGIFNVRLRVTDIDGCDRTFTQTAFIDTSDVIAPVTDVTTLPTITEQCEVTSITAPTATDNCGTVTGTTLTTFPITTSTTVVWTYTDGTNTATQNQSVIIEPINLVITNPDPICESNTVDITAPYITNGSTGNGILTYWNDLAATSSISNPTSITLSGTYYIKSVNGNCSDIKPVDVIIKKLPIASIEADDVVCHNNSGSISFEGTPNAIVTYTVNGGSDETITLNESGKAFISTSLLTVNTTYTLIKIRHSNEPFCSQNLSGSAISETIVVSKPGLIHQHWDDVLVFDNYDNRFVSWQWYKDGSAIAGATKQYYSNAILEGRYYVKATTINGEIVQTCNLDVSASNFSRKMTIIPNPVKSGSLFTADLDFENSILNGATLRLFDLKGNLITTQTVDNTSMKLRAPSTAGVYILSLGLSNGNRKTLNILVH
ncbi:putative secreted protein (Por secretion system target) [Aquimarina sp. MAR_2010_214]|uniref:PKD domain-containing protein n=1 Tax=Aquimarina sp. MAR_2010_214 TaxID=1250026 RepID=UPI000C70E174|nr:PKD domain-containing protein [Aquimarina sp. MAR_2010_214]PKV49866.1 putative secreted protein (Por secretion system target) [Aquimarina sp. MAR_2010_214]